MLPRRVLEISSVNGMSQVKLHIAEENKRGRYVALSYCWGGPQRLTTTTKTFLRGSRAFQRRPYLER